MFTERKRVLELIGISAIMNMGLFLITYFLKLPLWLDTTGTIYISYILGFPEGFIVAIINTVFQAVFFYGKESLLFYFVSVATALVTNLVLKKYKETKIKQWIILMISLIVVGGLAAVLITFWANDNIPANEISRNLYYYLNDTGFSNIAASAISVLAVKIPDVVVSVLISMFAIKLTPKKLKTQDIVILIDEE